MNSLRAPTKYQLAINLKTYGNRASRVGPLPPIEGHLFRSNPSMDHGSEEWAERIKA